jgi:hypothetical protein
MLETLFAVDLKGTPGESRRRAVAESRLAQAFLNRAHEALRAGNADIARQALRRGLAIAPSRVAAILRDPRLLVQMATLAVTPRLAGRLFGPGARRQGPGGNPPE